MSRRVAWTRAAVRDLRQLDRALAQRVHAALLRYAETEHGGVVRMQGIDPPQWRLKVGVYRALFHVEAAAPDVEDQSELIVVEHVLLRREAYR